MSYSCKRDGCEGKLRPLGKYLECPSCHDTYKRGDKGVRKIPGPKKKSVEIVLGRWKKNSDDSRLEGFDDGFYVASASPRPMIDQHRGSIRLSR